jgi:hypothetical protein
MEGLFQRNENFALVCQYIYSLMHHVVNNIDLFTRNNEVHNKSTRQNKPISPKNLLCQPLTDFYVNSFYSIEEYFSYKC